MGAVTVAHDLTIVHLVIGTHLNVIRLAGRYAINGHSGSIAAGDALILYIGLLGAVPQIDMVAVSFCHRRPCNTDTVVGHAASHIFYGSCMNRKGQYCGSTVVAQSAASLVDIDIVPIVLGRHCNLTVATLGIFTVNGGKVVVAGQFCAVRSGYINTRLDLFAGVHIVRIGQSDLTIVQAHFVPAAYCANTIRLFRICLVIGMAGRRSVVNGVFAFITGIHRLAGIDHLAADGTGGGNITGKGDLLQHALAVGVVDIIAQHEPTGLQHAAQQIVVVAGIIHDLTAVRIVSAAADIADCTAILQIVVIVVTVFGAGSFQRDRVNQTAIDVVVVDGHPVLVRIHRQIRRSKIGRRKLKDFIVIKNVLRSDAVRLLAGRTADIVVNTVIRINLIITQGVGSGGRVVMSGEHHVDAGRFGHIGYGIVDFGIAANCVGVVSRLVHQQDLPDSIAGGGILQQPIHRFLQLGGGTGIVDNGHVNITVSQGVVAAGLCLRGKIKEIGGGGSVSVAGVLMVAQDMDHIGTAEFLSAEQLCDVVPVAVCRCVINCVTGLDTEVIVACPQRISDTLNIGGIFGLNITQNEEVGFILLNADGGKGCDFAPGFIAAYLVLIHRAAVQTLQYNTIDINSAVAALAESAQGSFRLFRGPGVGTADAIANVLLGSQNGIAHPAHALAVSGIVHGIKHQAKGHSICLAGSIIGVDLALEGQCAVGIHSVDHGSTGSGTEVIRVPHTVFIGRTDLFVGLCQAQIHIGSGFTLIIGNCDGGVHAHQNRLCRDLISSLHGEGCLGGAVGIIGAVSRGIAAALDNVEELVRIGQIGRHTHNNGGNDIAVVCSGIGLTLGIHSQRVGQLAVGIGSLIIFGELHLIILKQVVEREHRGAALHIRAGSLDIQGYRLAEDCGVFGGNHGHAGVRDGSAGVDGKVTGLGGFIAESVTQGYRNGMFAIGQLHIVQVSDGTVGFGNILIAVVVHHIDTIHIHTNGCRVNAGGILILHIMEVGVDIQRIGGQYIAILQHLIVDADRVHHGSVGIVNVGAVHKLEVIEIQLAGALGTDHPDTVDEHQTEGHTGHEGEGACPLGQIGFQILPAFPIDAGLRGQPFTCIGILRDSLGLQCEVHFALGAAAVVAVAAQPQAGNKVAFGVLHTAVRHAHALRGIDPNTQAGGCAGNCHLIGSTHAGAFRNSAAVGKVKIQLQRVTAEANGIIIVQVGDFNGLFTAAAVVRCAQNTFFAAVIIRSRNYFTGFRIRVVLKIPNHGGEHTHDDMDRTADRTVISRNSGHRAVQAVVGIRHKDVAIKGAQPFGRAMPDQIAILNVHIAVLIANHQCQIALCLEAEAHLLGVEIDMIGDSNFNGGRAHDLAVLHHLNGYGAGLFTGHKLTGIGINGTHIHTVVSQCPSHAFGNIHGEACSIHATGFKLHLITGGIQLIVGGNGNMIELTGFFGSGNDQQSGADLTLSTVRG